MSITSLFNSVLSSYSGTRTLFADRMAAQRANSAAGRQEDEENKDVTASNNIDQYLSNKSNAGKVSAVEESSSSRSSEGKNSAPGSSVASKDASKPKSASGDVLELSEESRQSEKSENTTAAQGSDEELTEEERQQVTELKARDAEVRAHEAAHLAAAGQYAQGGASYTYQTGPDGKKYAIGGEVSIDAGAVANDPQATIQKAKQVRAAALAPASPSSQDQKVAAAASQMMSQAQMELMQQRTGEANEENSSGETSQAGATNSLHDSANKADDDSLSPFVSKKPSEIAAESSRNNKNSNSAAESALSSSSLTSGSSSKLSTPSDQYRLQSSHYSAANQFQGGFQAIG